MKLNGEYSVASNDDLIRFWRSKSRLMACKTCYGIIVCQKVGGGGFCIIVPLGLKSGGHARCLPLWICHYPL